MYLRRRRPPLPYQMALSTFHLLHSQQHGQGLPQLHRSRGLNLIMPPLQCLRCPSRRERLPPTGTRDNLLPFKERVR